MKVLLIEDDKKILEEYIYITSREPATGLIMLSENEFFNTDNASVKNSGNDSNIIQKAISNYNRNVAVDYALDWTSDTIKLTYHTPDRRNKRLIK